MMKLISCFKQTDRKRKVFGTYDLSVFSGYIEHVHDLNSDSPSVFLTDVKWITKIGQFEPHGQRFDLSLLYDHKSSAFRRLLDDLPQNESTTRYREELESLYQKAIDEEVILDKKDHAREMTCVEFVEHVYENADYPEDWQIAYQEGLSVEDVMNDDTTEYRWAFPDEDEDYHVEEEGNEDLIRITDYEENNSVTYNIYMHSTTAEAYYQKLRRDRHWDVDAVDERTVTIYTFSDNSRLQDDGGEYEVLESV